MLKPPGNVLLTQPPFVKALVMQNLSLCPASSNSLSKSIPLPSHCFSAYPFPVFAFGHFILFVFHKILRFALCILQFSFFIVYVFASSSPISIQHKREQQPLLTLQAASTTRESRTLLFLLLPLHSALPCLSSAAR